MRKQRRRAYTLLELILVCTLIAIVAAIALPSSLSAYDHFKLTSGGDAVRTGFVNARSHAVEESRRYRFAVELGKGKFRVAPDDPAYWSGTPPVDDEHPALILEESMPRGIIFKGGGNGSEKNGEWSTVAVFDTDGTALEDVTIEVSPDGSNQPPLVVTLRGMTGTSTVSKARKGGS